MIAWIWRGTTATHDAQGYVQCLQRTGLKRYRHPGTAESRSSGARTRNERGS
jgi:hypothetical protein